MEKNSFQRMKCTSGWMELRRACCKYDAIGTITHSGTRGPPAFDVLNWEVKKNFLDLFSTFIRRAERAIFIEENCIKKRTTVHDFEYRNTGVHAMVLPCRRTFRWRNGRGHASMTGFVSLLRAIKTIRLLLTTHWALHLRLPFLSRVFPKPHYQ